MRDGWHYWLICYATILAGATAITLLIYATQAKRYAYYALPLVGYVILLLHIIIGLQRYWRQMILLPLLKKALAGRSIMTLMVGYDISCYAIMALVGHTLSRHDAAELQTQATMMLILAYMKGIAPLLYHHCHTSTSSLPEHLTTSANINTQHHHTTTIIYHQITIPLSSRTHREYHHQHTHHSLRIPSQSGAYVTLHVTIFCCH